jgi:Cysteine sulfinate desulfinase/cysteine desulfurase and related enzymes
MAFYFDNASTTPVDPRVVERMNGCLSAEGTFGNPASTTHGFGWFASEEVEWARATVAEVIDADPREIVWTS